MSLNAQTPAHTQHDDKNKIPIILVVYGCTTITTINTYEIIINSFKKAFPDNPIYLTYTSEHATKEANENGKKILNVKQTIEELAKKGHTKIAIQSLHIMNGEEYMSIVNSISPHDIVIGQPLLSSESDLQKVSEILLSQCDKKIPTIIAAHGNSKFPEFNLMLQKLGAMVESKCSNAVLCTIKGEPGVKPLSKITDQVKIVNSVKIIPLMLVAGVHVKENLIGTDSSSWKNLLGVKNVLLSDPMGNLPLIHEIYISHCRDALKKLCTFTHKHGGNLRELSDQSELPIEQITDFSASINFLGPVPNLKEVVLNTLVKILYYPDPDYIELKKAIRAFGKWNTDMIVPANGASELLYAAAAVAKKERAVIPVPTYNDYILAAKRASLKVEYLYLPEHLQFQLKISSLSDLIKNNDVVFLGRPNNPTGQNFDTNEMRSLITNNKNVLFIIDESFLEFSSDNISIAQNLPDNCIMIRSMTKFYSIPGLRLGYAVANPDLALQISSMLTPWSINCFAQSVGIASLANVQYQMDSQTAIKNTREKFYGKLKSIPFLKVYPTNANFFLIKLNKPLNGSDLYLKMLKNGIAIRRCSNFVGLNDQYIRIAIRNDNDNDRFISVLERIWKERN